MSKEKTFDVILTRHYFFDDGIIGSLNFIWSMPSSHLYTLELPYRDNERNVSAIPSGEYRMRFREPTTRFPYAHMKIDRVEGRSGILFHRGNYPHETRGCILIGDDAATDKPVIFNSRKGYNQFMRECGLSMAAAGRGYLNLLIDRSTIYQTGENT